MSTVITPTGTPQGGALRKLIDLAVIRKTAGDFLTFFDDTKEVLYPYLYHRTGSVRSAQVLMTKVYLDVLSYALSIWWFGNLSTGLLLKLADKAIAAEKKTDADIDSVYLASLKGLKESDRKNISTLHDALWSLPAQTQRVFTLSFLLGLTNKRIGFILGTSEEGAAALVKAAREAVLERWQPQDWLASDFDKLSFLPALDIKLETTLRSGIVDKYSAMRLRKYQWVMVGGLLAIASNFIVAGLIGFVVITQPPTTLRGQKAEIAALDALLLQRKIEAVNVKQSIAASFEESKGIAAYDATRGFTNLGLAAALESLRNQQIEESQVDRLIRLMESAKTAYTPMDRVRLAFTHLHDFFIGTAEARETE